MEQHAFYPVSSTEKSTKVIVFEPVCFILLLSAK